MPSHIRILLLADTHLGFDLPTQARVKRRRRGHDFLANYATALAPALAGEVDIVVHGGDVFDRSSVPPSLAYQAFDPLRQIAERGVPVFIVPGNHERSRLPHQRFAVHHRVHVFDRPRTFVVDVRGTRIALVGFPYERRSVRTRFPQLLAQSEWNQTDADFRLLCIHHCVEGATVGPGNYVFTTADDVIRIGDVPGAFAAVLSGHIHRHQVLTTGLRKRAVTAPVVYPGSIERTSLAEIGEPKGFMIVRVDTESTGARVQYEFRKLTARPMIVHDFIPTSLSPTEFDSELRAIIAASPSDAVLTIRVPGGLSGAHVRCLSAARLRTFVPETMNVDISMPWRPRATSGSR